MLLLSVRSPSLASPIKSVERPFTRFYKTGPSRQITSATLTTPAASLKSSEERNCHTGLGSWTVRRDRRFARRISFGVTSGAMAETEGPKFQNPRVAVKKLLSKEQPEGDGATVRRSIGRPELKNFDPFLLLDYLEANAAGAGFPDHPHRGFETVSYILEGALQHQDFAGHKGIIGPGDLQWMTAGRGIVHCEMPATKGMQRGLQLWVNLPSKSKMVEPKYQEMESKNIPKVDKDGVKVVVIAGESFGIKSPVSTITPTMYLDFTLEPGAEVHQAVPEGWNAFLYILEGKPTIGTKGSAPIDAHHTVLLGPGNGISVWNTKSVKCQFILIGGEPINEPVVQYGPFVMNTQEEIMQAFSDYRSGRNGFENAKSWRSSPVPLLETFSR